MARKKKSAVASFLKKRSKPKAPKITTPRSNPSTGAMSELGMTVGTGAGAYLGNRLVTSIVKRILGPKVGKFSNHVGPATSLAIALLLLYVAEKVAFLRRYNNSVIVGNAVAVVQTIINHYLPGLTNLLDGFSAPSLPQATGEYVDGEDESLLLNGGSLDDGKLITAITDQEEDEDLATGIFAKN